MNKKIYIAPETDLIKTPPESPLLEQTKTKVGDEDVPMDKGDLGDGEEVSAKPNHYNLWDEDESFNSWK